MDYSQITRSSPIKKKLASSLILDTVAIDELSQNTIIPFVMRKFRHQPFKSDLTTLPDTQFTNRNS